MMIYRHVFCIVSLVQASCVGSGLHFKYYEIKFPKNTSFCSQEIGHGVLGVTGLLDICGQQVSQLGGFCNHRSFSESIGDTLCNEQEEENCHQTRSWRCLGTGSPTSHSSCLPHWCPLSSPRVRSPSFDTMVRFVQLWL